MFFRATEDQVKKMAALAVNASIPMGLGKFHATSKEFEPSDFEIDDSGSLDIDYFQGRMVKLLLAKDKENIWSTCGITPRSDYQSWVGKFPTYHKLALAAGIKIEDLDLEEME